MKDGLLGSELRKRLVWVLLRSDQILLSAAQIFEQFRKGPLIYLEVQDAASTLSSWPWADLHASYKLYNTSRAKYERCLLKTGT